MAAFYLGALFTRRGRLRDAEAAYDRAINSRQADAAPLAALNLGVLFEGKPDGDVRAEAAYREAIDSGHPDAAPRATAMLGLLLEGQAGREAEAEAAYREAIESGHPDAKAMGEKALGRFGHSLRRPPSE